MFMEKITVTWVTSGRWVDVLMLLISVSQVATTGNFILTLTGKLQISGANIVVNDPKPGATESVVIVSGTSDQMRAAQSLIHAFILCGVTS